MSEHAPWQHWKNQVELFKHLSQLPAMPNTIIYTSLHAITSWFCKIVFTFSGPDSPILNCNGDWAGANWAGSEAACKDAVSQSYLAYIIMLVPVYTQSFGLCKKNAPAEIFIYMVVLIAFSENMAAFSEDFSDATNSFQFIPRIQWSSISNLYMLYIYMLYIHMLYIYVIYISFRERTSHDF